MQRVVAAVVLVNDRVVVVNLRTLEVFGRTGNLAALEYEYGRYLQHGFGVEVLYGESNRDVGGNDAVVEGQNLGCAGHVDLVLMLGHLLEAVTARERQRGGYEHNAQLKKIFHSELKINV